MCMYVCLFVCLFFLYHIMVNKDSQFSIYLRCYELPSGLNHCSLVRSLALARNGETVIQRRSGWTSHRQEQEQALT